MGEKKGDKVAGKSTREKQSGEQLQVRVVLPISLSSNFLVSLSYGIPTASEIKELYCGISFKTVQNAKVKLRPLKVRRLL